MDSEIIYAPLTREHVASDMAADDREADCGEAHHVDVSMKLSLIGDIFFLFPLFF